MRKNYISKDNYAFFDGFVGKEHYMAPEVWRCHMNGKNGNDKSKYIYDPFKADIWSLGVILYLLYTNTYPFPKEDIRKTGGQYNVAKLKLHHSFLPPKVADLLSKIFLPEKKRLNTVQLLAHNYVGLIDESKLQINNKPNTITTNINDNNNNNETNNMNSVPCIANHPSNHSNHNNNNNNNNQTTTITEITPQVQLQQQQQQQIDNNSEDTKIQEIDEINDGKNITITNDKDNNNNNNIQSEEQYLPKTKNGQPKIIRHACKLVKLLYQS